MLIFSNEVGEVMNQYYFIELKNEAYIIGKVSSTTLRGQIIVGRSYLKIKDVVSMEMIGESIVNTFYEIAADEFADFDEIAKAAKDMFYLRRRPTSISAVKLEEGEKIIYINEPKESNAEEPYFIASLSSGDMCIGRIMPSTNPEVLRIGYFDIPIHSIEVMEEIDLKTVHKIYNVVNNHKYDEKRDVPNKTKQILKLDKRPSYVLAYYSDEVGYSIYAGYIEQSMI
jgi:hypothetical protein